MELDTLLFSFCFIALGGWWYYLFSYYRSRASLPPGPFCFPVVGALFSLREPLHQHFAALTKWYGAILYLKIGMVPYIVVNNAKAAEQVLKVHDVEFADRPHPEGFLKLLSLGYKNMVLSPYGKTWRTMRRISNVHLFSNAMLNLSAGFRMMELQTTVRDIAELCKAGKPINLRVALERWVSASHCLTLFGRKDLEVVELADAITAEALNVDVGELIPGLNWLDLHGIQKRMGKHLMPQMKSLVERVIEDHKQRKARAGPDFVCRDFTDALISLENEDVLEDISVLALLCDMLAGGLETTRGAVEWTMAELINNPHIMLKAHEELDKVVGLKSGCKSGCIQESDLPDLPYIQAIVKESLRLHATVPLGVPHLNRNEVKLGSYTIPAGCRVMINIWAIGRDPEHWSEPDKFQPERFLESNLSVTGQNFQAIPFSAGRRICPGYPLALRSINLAIATLLHKFEWSSPGGGSIHLEEVPRNMISKLASDLLVSACPREY